MLYNCRQKLFIGSLIVQRCRACTTADSVQVPTNARWHRRCVGAADEINSSTGHGNHCHQPVKVNRNVRAVVSNHQSHPCAPA